MGSTDSSSEPLFPRLSAMPHTPHLGGSEQQWEPQSQVWSFLLVHLPVVLWMPCPSLREPSGAWLRGRRACRGFQGGMQIKRKTNTAQLVAFS